MDEHPSSRAGAEPPYTHPGHSPAGAQVRPCLASSPSVHGCLVAQTSTARLGFSLIMASRRINSEATNMVETWV